MLSKERIESCLLATAFTVFMFAGMIIDSNIPMAVGLLGAVVGIAGIIALIERN